MSLGCSHLLLGTSLTSLAISLIAGISQGGGFHVREEAQEEWSADSLHKEFEQGGKKGKRHSVRIIRPLREIGMKECGIWSWWMRLPIVGREKWQWPGTKPGLGRLTKGKLLICVSHDIDGTNVHDEYRLHLWSGEGLPIDCVDYCAHMQQAGTEGR